MNCTTSMNKILNNKSPFVANIVQAFLSRDVHDRTRSKTRDEMSLIIQGSL